MRFHQRFVVLSLCLSAAAALPAEAKPAGKGCAQHADCGSPSQYCREQKCVEIGRQESLLAVALTTAVPAPVRLYIDGTLVGELPWEGIVTPAVHAIHLESAGMQPMDLEGASEPGARESIAVTMTPLGPGPSQGGPPAPGRERAPDGGRGTPGVGFVAASGGIGVGTAFMSVRMRAATTLLFGGSVGLGIPKLPVWVDLGVSATGSMTRFADYNVDDDGDGEVDRPMAFGDLVKLNLALLVRVLYPVKKNFFYIGGELEPGYSLSNQHWVYADLRLAMSLFVHEMFEIRLNPVGGEFAQSFGAELTGYVISYQATLGLALRFP